MKRSGLEPKAGVSWNPASDQAAAGPGPSSPEQLDLFGSAKPLETVEREYQAQQTELYGTLWEDIFR